MLKSVNTDATYMKLVPLPIANEEGHVSMVLFFLKKIGDF
jgi:hypothetical protein